MGFRKIIKFGTSSYVVSLPLNWVNKNNIVKGSVISIKENGNNELTIKASPNPDIRVNKKFFLDVTKLDPTSITREIMSAYINDYDNLEVICQGEKSRGKLKIVQNFVHDLVGLEVLEHTNDKILVKDFLNIEDVHPTTLIRRMDSIIRVMFETLEKDFKYSKISTKDNFERLMQLDKSINRIQFLMQRLLRRGIDDSDLRERIKVSLSSFVTDYLKISDHLENIADDIKRTSRFLNTAMASRIKKNEIEDLREIFLDLKDSYNDVMNAYYSDDKINAHKVASKRESYVKKCNELFNKYDNKAIAALLEKIKGIQVHIRDIARSVIDKQNAIERRIST